MIIVRDIHDAEVMRKTLMSIQSRANTFAKSKEAILVEIGMLIEDLTNNIEREEALVADEQYLKGM